MSFSYTEYTKIDVGWDFAPDPTGELTALSQTPSLFQGGRFAAGGMEGREGKDYRGRGKGEGRKRGNGEGRGIVGSWGNSALVVGR